jgi:hypothetical protein
MKPRNPDIEAMKARCLPTGPTGDLLADVILELIPKVRHRFNQALARRDFETAQDKLDSLKSLVTAIEIRIERMGAS